MNRRADRWREYCKGDPAILFLTNMFPTLDRPAFGTFVKASSDSLRSCGWLVRVTAMPFYGVGLSGYLKFYLSSFMELLRFKGVVYVHYVSHSAFPAVVASVFNRELRIVLHYHGSDAFPEAAEGSFRCAWKYAICGLANASATAVVAPSKGFLVKLKQKFNLERLPVTVSPSGGVDTTVFEPCVSEERRIDLVFVGRMIEGKGGLAAARVAARVLAENPRATALFIGDGPERPRMESLLQRYVVDGSVQFLGLLPQGKLAKALRDCRVMLFPSTRQGESLGLAWIEAAFCGAVPLILKSGGADLSVPNELKEVLLVDDESSMGERAMHFLACPSRLTLIRRQLLQRVTEAYSREHVVTQLDGFLRSVV